MIEKTIKTVSNYPPATSPKFPQKMYTLLVVFEVHLECLKVLIQLSELICAPFLLRAEPVNLTLVNTLSQRASGLHVIRPGRDFARVLRPLTSLHLVPEKVSEYKC